jgi:hypothetical protein
MKIRPKEENDCQKYHNLAKKGRYVSIYQLGEVIRQETSMFLCSKLIIVVSPTQNFSPKLQNSKLAADRWHREVPPLCLITCRVLFRSSVEVLSTCLGFRRTDKMTRFVTEMISFPDHKEKKAWCTPVCDSPASRTQEPPRSAHRRDRSRLGRDATYAEVQASGAHLSPERLLTCDGSVGMRSAFVMPS